MKQHGACGRCRTGKIEEEYEHTRLAGGMRYRAHVQHRALRVAGHRNDGSLCLAGVERVREWPIRPPAAEHVGRERPARRVPPQ